LRPSRFAIVLRQTTPAKLIKIGKTSLTKRVSLICGKFVVADGRNLVLCDADMIFLREIVFPERFAAEGCSNLNYDDRRVRAAANRFGIDKTLLMKRKNSIECAVPHVVPVAYAGKLARVGAVRQRDGGRLDLSRC